MPLVFLLFALFASVFTISKGALNYSQPFFLVGVRMFFAGVIIVGYLAWIKKEKFNFERKYLWQLLALAVFNIYLTNVFEFWGLKYLTSFKTCFFYSLSPFLSALFSYLILSEKMSLKKWIGLLIGCIGITPILMAQGAEELSTGSFFIFSWPELAVLTACMTSVYGWILLRQLVNESKTSPLMTNSISMIIGGAFALLHSFFTEDWNPFPISDPVPFLYYSLALMVVSNLICYNLYGYLLKKYSATFMSFAGSVTPIFTALFGWFFLEEVITWEFYVSFVILFIGLYIFNQEELKALEISKTQTETARISE